MSVFLKRTGIFLQARLNSSRLPGKALLQLSGKSLIAHCISRLSIVPADVRVIVTSRENNKVLEEIASEYGWDIFYGSEHNVLKRFVDAVKFYNVDIVIRSTADNPLVSPEIARETIDLFHKKDCDLAHLEPVPYGSGIEVINAEALITSLKKTKIPFNLEHITQYIYKHNEKFKVECIRFNDDEVAREDVRLTVDTIDDFEKMNYLIRNLNKKSSNLKIKTVVSQYDELDYSKFKRLLCVTACSDNYGVGHIKRIAYIVKKLSSDFNIFLTLKNGNIDTAKIFFDFNYEYIKYDDVSKFVNKEGIFDRVLVDMRETEYEEMNIYRGYGPVISIDDMGLGGIISSANIKTLPYFSDVKEKKFFNFDGLEYLFVNYKKEKEANFKLENIKNVLVTFGGSDPDNLTNDVAEIFDSRGYNTTHIKGPFFKEHLRPFGNCKILTDTYDLENLIKDSDLIVTSFGMTLFESLLLNKPVVVINPTKYHDKLTDSFGYPYLIKRNLKTKADEKPHENLKEKLKDIIIKIKHENILNGDTETPLSKFFSLNIGKKKNDIVNFIKKFNYYLPVCPNCACNNCDSIIYRTTKWNMYKCNKCELIYMRPLLEYENEKYEEDYFVFEYKKKYGKTYEEDKENIANLAENRLKIIKTYIEGGKLLDFGSGMGFFADLCEKNGFHTLSIDKSKYAVDYITNVLKLKSIQSGEEYLEKTDQIFDIITSFYVIEHVKDFKKLLFLFKCHLNKNGVLVLSTPNSVGKSIKYNFFNYVKEHPDDHYIIISPLILKKILKKMGFGRIKINITGIHIERFIKSKMLQNNKFVIKVVTLIAKLFHLGDTFEIYAQKL